MECLAPGRGELNEKAGHQCDRQKEHGNIAHARSDECNTTAFKIGRHDAQNALAKHRLTGRFLQSGVVEPTDRKCRKEGRIGIK